MHKLKKLNLKCDLKKCERFTRKNVDFKMRN